MNFRAICVAVFAATLGFGQASTDWRFAHPDADFRLSLNFQALMKSPMVTAGLKKAQEGSTKEQVAQMQMIVGMLSSVDRISISARQLPTPPAGAKPAAAAPAPKRAAAATPAPPPTNPAANSDVLVLVSGSFDPALVQSFFPSTGTSQVKPVGDHAVLIGDGASFTKALQRMSGSAVQMPPDELSQNDLWLSGNASLMSQSSPATATAFNDIKAFSLGVNFTESPEANLSLTAGSSDAAARVMAEIQIALAATSTNPQAAMMTKLLQFNQDGSRIRMHMSIPPEVMQMAQTLATQNVGGANSLSSIPFLGLLGLSGAAPGPAVTPAAAPTPAPQPKPSGDIVIYGLEGGPKVIKTN
jgi:hypothetical protein